MTAEAGSPAPRRSLKFDLPIVVFAIGALAPSFALRGDDLFVFAFVSVGLPWAPTTLFPRVTSSIVRYAICFSCFMCFHPRIHCADCVRLAAPRVAFLVFRLFCVLG